MWASNPASGTASHRVCSVLAAGGGSLSEVQRGKLLVQLSEVDRRITDVPRVFAVFVNARVMFND
jgi:hypothetical protein